MVRSGDGDGNRIPPKDCSATHHGDGVISAAGVSDLAGCSGHVGEGYNDRGWIQEHEVCIDAATLL